MPKGLGEYTEVATSKQVLPTNKTSVQRAVPTYGAVPLGGAVELDDVDAEAVDDLLPDPRPQPVAEHDADPVAPLVVPVGAGGVLAAQVPRHLADVLSRLFWE